MKNTGFSLIELMIVMAIAGILLTVGIPSFQDSIKNNQITSTSNGLVGAFNYARLEAINTGNSIFLGQRNGADWTGGVVVWLDEAGGTAGSWDSGEEIRLWDAASSTNIITSENRVSRFRFKPTGEINNDDVLTVCDDRVGEQGIKILLLESGMITSQRIACV